MHIGTHSISPKGKIKLGEKDKVSKDIYIYSKILSP